MNPVAPKIRMGFVGGGEGAFIGQAHRQAAGLDGGFELVCGAFSRDPHNTRQTGAALGLPASRCYHDWQQMLDTEALLPLDQRMELLVIVTPNHLHAPIASQALKAGFHVFSEKPAALDLNELLALRDVLQGSRCLYGLAHTYLGYPMVWQAREMVRSGEIGQVRKVLVEYPKAGSARMSPLRAINRRRGVTTPGSQAWADASATSAPTRFPWPSSSQTSLSNSYAPSWVRTSRADNWMTTPRCCSRWRAVPAAR